MFDVNENDPISPAMRALLDVFSNELAEVKFPDVDSEVLEEAAGRVRSQAEAVTRALAALEAARQALAESQDQLLQKGHRALAYARVFAEEDIDLSMKVEAINLPKRGSRPEVGTSDAASQNDDNAPKRRGRPPKSRPSAPLFADGSSPEATAAEATPAAPARPAPPVPVRPEAA